jgi:NAD(P)-dependent dehydrogenase (short-subunit alcohol dehydrogenase family)
MAELIGRRVLIAGASSGIGFTAAEAFAREGADVALVARGRKGLETAAARARAHGVAAHVITADLGVREEADAAVESAARALGGLDVLVWNAGAMVYGQFPDVPAELFDRTMEVTFGGAVDTVRAALPHLEASAGTIVATGSIMCRVPLAGFSSYAAAKHALRGFLGSLRVELLERKSPVSISMVHAGPVDTPLWDHVDSVTGRLPRNPPRPALYSPETIAAALVACAIRPRAEVTIGGESRIIEVGFALLRPVADRVLMLGNRYYSTGRTPARGPGPLHRSADEGRASGGRHGRPSLWAVVRLGRRLLPG